MTPQKQCRHKRTGLVKSGALFGTYAARNVCDRVECIAKAKLWASRQTGKEAIHVLDKVRLKASDERPF